MKNIGLLLFTVFTAAITGQAAAQTRSTTQTSCDDIVGIWQNQLGSTMIITSVNSRTKLVSGCYCSPSGTESEWFPLTGWTNSQDPQEGKDNVKPISWAVHWGKYGSIASWSGYCADLNGTPTVSTLWHLMRSNADQRWAHRLTDTDTFVPADNLTCDNPPPYCQLR